MSKKFTFSVLFLGFIFTYIVAILDDLRKGFVGDSGIPLRFASFGGLLGGAQTNYVALLLNVLFWSLIIGFLCKLTKKYLIVHH